MIDRDAELNERMLSLISRHAECERLEEEREAARIAARPNLSRKAHPTPEQLFGWAKV